MVYACLRPNSGASSFTSFDEMAAASRARELEACGVRSLLRTSQRTIAFPSPRIGSKHEKTGLWRRVASVSTTVSHWWLRHQLGAGGIL